MGKILAAAVVLAVGVSVAVGEEFRGIITKVDGNKVTVRKFAERKEGQKRGERGERGEELTLTAASNVKVLTTKYDRETEKFTVGGPLEGGLENERFKRERAFNIATIVTDDNNVIQEIRVSEREFRGFQGKGGFRGKKRPSSN